ncbi:transposase [Prosthecochloris sp. HL-130-GSB]|jgi:transposase|uniref:transposase n=1 Tax=Prosthecochloris sp. HL-130-GSB TaxID=1974213 RepID=UPI000A1C0F8B|nr:transposase [Prosthecochloris sp. HL-130-GSB]ARM30480.1 transposase [Prosthecochloris sp. HL-130-GSB]ARM30739.1 transposase [Prosthecochloris sp. HL-130-GSB]ARM30946.1 transposase [Prosthecochloris sp. HL-130-GSB]ARM31166.1 transposase [Prosthecochloris sp. HL-130-GSB]ARM31321.1 transposase [Prosthecochloris sp. HL-130-GSB]
MGYSHAVRQSILKKVLPPESRSIAEVSRETGINHQTIRNWIKQAESGILADGTQDSCPRFLTPKEKYELVVEAAGIDDEQLGEFLRERGLHTEHLTIWNQELRDMVDKKSERQDKENKELKKKVRDLEKELQRKEKALAEAAALLVLKKKLNALIKENEDD